MVAEAWPSSRWTALMLAPAAIASDAAVWRGKHQIARCLVRKMNSQILDAESRYGNGSHLVGLRVAENDLAADLAGGLDDFDAPPHQINSIGAQRYQPAEPKAAVGQDQDDESVATALGGQFIDLFMREETFVDTQYAGQLDPFCWVARESRVLNRERQDQRENTMRLPDRCRGESRCYELGHPFHDAGMRYLRQAGLPPFRQNLLLQQYFVAILCFVKYFPAKRALIFRPCWRGFRRNDPVPAEVRSGPLVELPHREYFLYSGTIEQALAFVDSQQQTPNLWWPEVQAWCITSEIDLPWTYVGGRSDLIEQLVSDTRIEAQPTTPNETIQVKVTGWLRGAIERGVAQLLTPAPLQ